MQHTLLLAVLMSLIQLPRVEACSCSGIVLMGDYERSSLVFVGRVVSGRLTKVIDSELGELEEVEVTFEISEQLKGAATKTVTVTTPLGNGECGFAFAIGREYLVFARGASLRTDSCTNTRPLGREANEMIQEIKKRTRMFR